VSECRTILIVDDEQGTVDAMQNQLSKRGYHTLAAYDGMDALLKLSQNKVDLLLLDIKMPHLDGMELFKKILSDRARFSCPVLFISAYEEFRAEIEQDEGVAGFLKKPFTIDDLIGRINNIFGRNEG